MTTSTRRLRTAAISLIVLGVLGAASLVLALVVLARPAGPSLSVDEQAALSAGRRLVADLTTYHRATFDADWDRAVAGTTGGLRAEELAARDTTRAALTKYEFDIKGVVVAAGVESATPATVVLSVLQNGYRVDAGKDTLTSTNRLQVTVTKVQGRWLLSAVTNVPLV